jgi:hypothetical protein
MKKIIISLIILLIIFSVYYIMYKLIDLPNPLISFGWQKVSIKGVGTFKIPRDWIVTQKNKSIFITDKPIEENGYKIYLAGVIIYKYDNNLKKDEINGKWLYYYSNDIFFKNVQFIESTPSMVFSNSTYVGINKYNINENIKEIYYLDLRIKNGAIEFLSWDNMISEDILIEIAKTFDRE